MYLHVLKNICSLLLLSPSVLQLLFFGSYAFVVRRVISKFVNPEMRLIATGNDEDEPEKEPLLL